MTSAQQEVRIEEGILKLSLNYPQAVFLSQEQKFKAFIGGYGSGKTWVGCAGIAKHMTEHPRVPAGYFAPTYPQIRDIFYPTIEEALHPWGYKVKIKASVKEVDIYRGKIYYGTTICRSMDSPETIVGFKIGHALVDEIDVMKPEKAQITWRKIIARMRVNAPGLLNGIDVTTTPEGFRFAYRQFKEQVIQHPELAPLYGLVHASTYDNELNLPAGYIASLYASYPPNLVDAYIEGLFVNLQTGSVYSAYDRESNDCSDEIGEAPETLYIGMDFNVSKMAAIVHVLRAGQPRAVDEITNGYDTPDMIRMLKERYWKHKDGKYVPFHNIRIYPDASGGSRKSVNASETDLSLLRSAGFTVVANFQNPPVKDRVNSMNAMFCNAQGERRYRVNHRKCPVYSSSLVQQSWGTNGEPDKTTGHDHTNDGAGYYIQTEFGINKPMTKVKDMF